MFEGKAYGSIAHLPGSRTGRTDKYVTPGQARIATHKARDSHDRIIVQEKLDGSCVAVYRDKEDAFYPLTRNGNLCNRSQFIHHHLFKDWCDMHLSRFKQVLEPGERLVGEWLALAHGTRYYPERVLGWEPFVAFDIMRGTRRLPYSEFAARVEEVFHTPPLVHQGGPFSIEAARKLHSESGYGGEHVEGYIWRVERNEYAKNGPYVDYLCKWVDDAFEPGILLPELSGNLVWNWEG